MLQLAGLPVEVVDAVVSLLSRLAFDFGLWSDGAMPMLFVCEEAHRYASVDRAVGFAPTRRALLRIAKEGRKYGVCLGLVTQRPAELDPTIISQCSTLFAMRMVNDRDQALLRSAVTDAAANLRRVRPIARHPRSRGIRRGLPVADPPELQGAAGRAHPHSETFREDSAIDAVSRLPVLRQTGGGAVARRGGTPKLVARGRDRAESRPPTRGPPPASPTAARLRRWGLAGVHPLDQIRAQLLRR